MLTRKMASVGLAMLIGGAGMTAAAPALANPEFKIRGRFHVDYAVYDEDDVSLGDGFLNRRARLGMSGKIDENWSGIVEYDFAENSTAASDVMLNRKVGANGTLKIGQFKVPMGLNELTSSNAITFIERAANSNSFVDARRIGIGYDFYQGALGFQTMAFGRRIGTDAAGDEPIGVAARVVYAPAVGAGLLHLGASVAYEDVGDFQVQRYRDRPEARPDGNRLIDTGNISGVSSTTKYGLELAFQSGPFSAEAEYISVDLSRDAGAEPTFSGYHVQSSYVLTGEKRGYRNGVFRGITPGQAGRGAWEVAARYSSVDLIDSGFQGGKQDNFTLGLNYYASANVRFMLNYIMVDVKDSNATVGGIVVGDESPNILIGRAMFYF
jgi:phosphate-selective porin OprO and OprP